VIKFRKNEVIILKIACVSAFYERLKKEVSELCELRMDDLQYLKKLIESMPRRLQAVKCHQWEDNPTKY